MRHNRCSDRVILVVIPNLSEAEGESAHLPLKTERSDAQPPL